MNPSSVALLELLLVFGVALGIGLHQILKLRPRRTDAPVESLRPSHPSEPRDPPAGPTDAK